MSVAVTFLVEVPTSVLAEINFEYQVSYKVNIIIKILFSCLKSIDFSLRSWSHYHTVKIVLPSREEGLGKVMVRN